MAQDWTREEVEATVADYLAMLSAEHMGREYSKAEHRRRLGKLLNKRSDGAIERKHQNISAILIELGLPYVDGYKPLRNYQQLLFEVVEDRLRNTQQLIAMVAEEVQRPPSYRLSMTFCRPLWSHREGRLGPIPMRCACPSDPYRDHESTTWPWRLATDH